MDESIRFIAVLDELKARGVISDGDFNLTSDIMGDQLLNIIQLKVQIIRVQAEKIGRLQEHTSQQ